MFYLVESRTDDGSEIVEELNCSISREDLKKILLNTTLSQFNWLPKRVVYNIK